MMILIIILFCFNVGLIVGLYFYFERMIRNEHQRLITRMLNIKCPLHGMGDWINRMWMEQKELQGKVGSLTTQVEEMKEQQEAVLQETKKKKEKTPVKIPGFNNDWSV